MPTTGDSDRLDLGAILGNRLELAYGQPVGPSKTRRRLSTSADCGSHRISPTAVGPAGVKPLDTIRYLRVVDIGLGVGQVGGPISVLLAEERAPRRPPGRRQPVAGCARRTAGDDEMVSGPRMTAEVVVAVRLKNTVSRGYRPCIRRTWRPSKPRGGYVDATDRTRTRVLISNIPGLCRC